MSTYTLTDFNAVIDRNIKDGGGYMTSSEIDSMIGNELVQMYSKHRPCEKHSDISANGTYSYTINATNFPGWVDGFSQIKDVWYPAGESQNPDDDLIPFEEWTVYKTSSASYLRFIADTPSSGTIRVKYVIPHTIGATVALTTIYDNDFVALVHLGSAFCLMALANRYAQTSDSTIGADAVAYREKSDIYAARSKDFYKMYMNYMFPDIEASGSLKEFDVNYPTGDSRLTHLPDER